MSTAAYTRDAPLVGLIWAQTTNGVIGKDGGMPWHLPEDLAHFKRTTAGHPVIMGRRTWESFPARYRPLPGRTNIVISRSPQRRAELEAGGAVVAGSLPLALAEARRHPGAEQLWVIGGGEIFQLAAEEASSAVVTVIDMESDGDTFAPPLGAGWVLEDVSPGAGWDTGANGTRYRIARWVRPAAA
ncbi:dihydrofolate reductase [Arthrobacter deserti]|uniref:Dihydrofolate reductase n=1 Tax=Arthrobacter deserti TaxID=1742687 RepID=A0ABX1JUH9_9MICC|nr:dihydrofolate reductase [Arthrobacter deserti]